MLPRCSPVVLALSALVVAGCDESTAPFAFLDDVTGDAGADASARDDAGSADTGDERDTSATDAGGAGDVADSVDDAVSQDTETDSPELDGVFVDAAPEGATTVSVATFNVARFFDPFCDSGQCGPDDFEYQPSEAQFEYRAFQIAEGIRAIDAEIILLQEVETQDCLDELTRQLGDEWRYSVIGEMGFSASLDVAVLAVHPIVAADVYRDDIAVERPDGSTTTFAREFLEAELAVAGAPVIVFSSHFKSKNNDDAGRRFGEAASARDIVLSRAAARPDALVVLGGDLNDTPGSPPLAELERLGGLVRAGIVLGDRAGTITYRGQSQAIDHLYLGTDSGGQIIEDSVRVVRDASGDLGGSDHAALRATFVLP